MKFEIDTLGIIRSPYKEKFAIIVDCADEAEQQQTFERLDSMGFTCKVLVN